MLKSGGVLVSTLTPPSPEIATAHRATGKRYTTAESGSELAEIGKLIDEGKVKPHIAKTFRLEEAGEAQKFLETQRPAGKVVLAVGSVRSGGLQAADRSAWRACPEPRRRADPPQGIDICIIMLWFIVVMIDSVPTISNVTISRPKASASTLLVLSGPVVMCRKKTRWTPICAIASTDSAIGMLGARSGRARPTKTPRW